MFSRCQLVKYIKNKFRVSALICHIEIYARITDDDWCQIYRH